MEKSWEVRVAFIHSSDIFTTTVSASEEVLARIIKVAFSPNTEYIHLNDTLLRASEIKSITVKEIIDKNQ